MSSALAASVQHVLELAQRHLGLDAAFLAEFVGESYFYRGLSGDGASFGAYVGAVQPLAGTYCDLMVSGAIANVVPDAHTVAAVRDLPLTRDAGIGAYVGVPITLADGSTYGSIGAVSHEPRSLDEKDARFLRALAELVSVDVQAQRDRSTARDRIEELIVAERLDIALQPIVDITTGRLSGVEALSRFPAEFGRPDEVFAAAGAAGIGTRLEGLAAATAYGVLPLLPPGIYLAINMTPPAAMELAADYDDATLPLDELVLEITEHAAVESYQQLRDSLAAVRTRGIRLAIDDAGAGYASLAHIVELRPDIIKVDRSLIDGMAGDPGRRSVVRAFVALAADLGATVVAEGVEQAADLQAARELGVDAAQGFLLARPSTDREDLPRWLSGAFGAAE